jgi:uncharacterized protein with GYD domain
MPKYLLATTYTAEGLRGLAREGGTARRAEVAGLCESMGGKLEAFYFTTVASRTCTKSRSTPRLSA